MLQRTLAIFGRLYIISEFENLVKRKKLLNIYFYGSVKCTISVVWEFIAYQNKNWLKTLHVTFTIPRYRQGC